MLAPLNTSRRGYTLVHMDYINVMPVVSFNSTKQCPAKLSSVTITAVYGGADQGFRRLARASGSLGKKDCMELSNTTTQSSTKLRTTPYFQTSPRESPPVSL